MTLAYVMDGGMSDSPGLDVDLYERFGLVRRLYREVAEWTGLEVDRLPRWELPLVREYRYAGAIRQAAVTLGACDLLAEQGIKPDRTNSLPVPVVHVEGREDTTEALMAFYESGLYRSSLTVVKDAKA
jgi:hypothetical protein